VTPAGTHFGCSQTTFSTELGVSGQRCNGINNQKPERRVFAEDSLTAGTNLGALSDLASAAGASVAAVMGGTKVTIFYWFLFS
jgi:hypothetical protein